MRNRKKALGQGEGSASNRLKPCRERMPDGIDVLCPENHRLARLHTRGQTAVGRRDGGLDGFVYDTADIPNFVNHLRALPGEGPWYPHLTVHCRKCNSVVWEGRHETLAALVNRNIKLGLPNAMLDWTLTNAKARKWRMNKSDNW